MAARVAAINLSRNEMLENMPRLLIKMLLKSVGVVKNVAKPMSTREYVINVSDIK